MFWRAGPDRLRSLWKTSAVPTTFHIRIAKDAQDDIQAIHDRIAQDKKRAAAKWVRDVYRLIRSLRRSPFRFEILPEAEDADRSWRHIIFGNYRICYRVDGNRVAVLRIVHAARLFDRGWLDAKAKEEGAGEKGEGSGRT